MEQCHPDEPLPVIDLSQIGASAADQKSVGLKLREAAEKFGFFYLSGPQVPVDLAERLESLSRQFFASPASARNALRMSLAGPAWRGYFAVGEELTSGRPDQKEGLYFGAELDRSDRRVQQQLPLHGANQFPPVEGFRQTVIEYLERMTSLGHSLMRLVSSSLGLDADFFQQRFTYDPLVLLRVFHYPPLTSQQLSEQLASVGEHTDYGLLTVLYQDQSGGLQVKNRDQWINAIPIPNTMICNIGDMLERMTGGRFRSTPHRVLNRSGVSRISIPFFFDPAFDSQVTTALTTDDPASQTAERWDGRSVFDFEGTYGEYILSKVAPVFPNLFAAHLGEGQKSAE